MPPGFECGSGILCCPSREHAVAWMIDELLGLRDRERDSVVAAVVRIRSDELVLFRSIRRVSLDRSRRLVVIVAQIGSGANAVTLILNDRNRSLLGCGPDKATPRGFEFGEHSVPVRSECGR